MVRILWVIFSVFVFFAGSVEAALTRSLNFEELVDFSDRIFLGTVVRVEAGPIIDKTPSQTTVFQVREVYKGEVGETYGLRQMAQKLPNGTTRVFTGLPVFKAGETVVVFLTGESSIGFSSPVGFDQGVFRVRGIGKDDSRARAQNRFMGQTLFTRLQGTRLKRALSSVRLGDGSMPLYDLRELIRVHRGLP